MRVVAVCAVLATFWGGIALAEETPAPAPSGDQAATTTQSTPAPAANDEDNKVVCKKEEAATGTRIGARKICKTQREWDSIARESQQAVQRAQDAGLRNNPSSGGGN